jgi:hypothetical protein
LLPFSTQLVELNIEAILNTFECTLVTWKSGR